MDTDPSQGGELWRQRGSHLRTVAVGAKEAGVILLVVGEGLLLGQANSQ